MMSQNRQEIRDRLRAENDYQVNLKAELEVRAISEKLDLLIHQHSANLLEIQQVQTEMIQDLLSGLAAGKREQIFPAGVARARISAAEPPMSINKRDPDTDEIAKQSQGNAAERPARTRCIAVRPTGKRGPAASRGLGPQRGPLPKPAAPDEIFVRDPDEKISADQAEHLRILCREAGECSTHR